jgi:hypothetical protein
LTQTLLEPGFASRLAAGPYAPLAFRTS